MKCKRVLPSNNAIARAYTRTFRILDPIVKSKSDARNYKALELSNGLQALLVSDPQTIECASAMDVKVGYFADPENIAGLAHFCEHMLFLGTTKYPDEKTYKQHLSKNGGICNASTAAEHTNYYFTINNSQISTFDSTLDIFSCFFKSPLFNLDATNRELNAVDSEFRRNLNLDNRRMGQLLKHLTNKRHPFCKFSTGNVDTLGKNKGHVRSHLLSLYEHNYVANRMKLVLYGKQTIAELQEMLIDRFHDVRSSQLSHESSYHAQGSCSPIFSNQEVPSMHFAVPVMESKYMTMFWELPSVYSVYDRKPIQFLTKFIDHRERGSLYDVLKNQLGLIENISTQLYASGSSFSILSVTFGMTEQCLEGDYLKNFYIIQKQLFACLEEIRRHISSTHNDTSNIHFEEMKRLNQISFDHIEKISSGSYSRLLAGAMQNYPIQDVLYHTYRTSRYDAPLMQRLLSMLTPSLVKVLVVAKRFENEQERYKQEPYYGTRYDDFPIPHQWIKEFTFEGKQNISLPSANLYIPTDFGINKLVVPPKKQNRRVPVQHLVDPFTCETIEANSNVHNDIYYHRLWYLRDLSFNVPYAHLFSHVRFESKHIADVKSAVAMRMWFNLVHERLAPSSYHASQADIHYDLMSMHDGVVIYCGGFNDKLLDFADQIYDNIVDMDTLRDQASFDRVKNKLIRTYDNMSKMQAHEQANYHINHLVSEPFHHLDQSLVTASAISLDDVRFFKEIVMKSSVRIDTFYNGNLNEKDCIMTAKSMNKKLIRSLSNLAPLQANQIITPRTIRLSKGEYLYECSSTIPNDSNSGVDIRFQLGENTIVNKCKLQLLARIIRVPFFQELRTRQQLGYSINAADIIQKDDLSFHFSVLTAAFDPRDAYLRMDHFILHFFPDLLSKMSDLMFEEYKQSLINVKKKLPKNLTEESYQYWNEIDREQIPIWDRARREIEVIQNLSLSDLIEFYEHNFTENDAVRIAVLVYGKRHDRSSTTATSEYSNRIAKHVHIADISVFKKNRCH